MQMQMDRLQQQKCCHQLLCESQTRQWVQADGRLKITADRKLGFDRGKRRVREPMQPNRWFLCVTCGQDCYETRVRGLRCELLQFGPLRRLRKLRTEYAH